MQLCLALLPMHPPPTTKIDHVQSNALASSLSSSLPSSSSSSSIFSLSNVAQESVVSSVRSSLHLNRRKYRSTTKPLKCFSFSLTPHCHDSRSFCTTTCATIFMWRSAPTSLDVLPLYLEDALGSQTLGSRSCAQPWNGWQQ